MPCQPWPCLGDDGRRAAISSPRALLALVRHSCRRAHCISTECCMHLEMCVQTCIAACTAAGARCCAHRAAHVGTAACTRALLHVHTLLHAHVHTAAHAHTHCHACTLLRARTTAACMHCCMCTYTLLCTHTAAVHATHEHPAVLHLLLPTCTGCVSLWCACMDVYTRKHVHACTRSVQTPLLCAPQAFLPCPWGGLCAGTAHAGDRLS